MLACSGGGCWLSRTRMKRQGVVAGLLFVVAAPLTACGDDNAALSPTVIDVAGQPNVEQAGAGAGGNDAGQGGAGGAIEPDHSDIMGGSVGELGGAGPSPSGGAPSCMSDADCDDANGCTDDACEDGACVSTNNKGACDDGNECTDDDQCLDGACQGTNNENDCDDSSTCTSDDKCGDGSCNGLKNLALCPSCVDENLLQNCDFADGATHWTQGFTDSEGRQYADNQRLIVDIAASGVEIDDVQPRLEGLALKHGMKYRLRLVAGASVNRSIVVRLLQVTAPHRIYASFSLDVSEQMKPFERELVMVDPSDGNVSLELALGGTEGNPSRVYFDDMYLSELKCAGAADCDDANDCTADACDVGAGTCSWSDTGAACADDGNECTKDLCVAGECAHQPLANDSTCASDADGCTSDACSAGACGHVFDTGVCSCTQDEHCDDGNPCTDDVCNAGACEYTENAAICDDHKLCTSGDVCSGGLCVGTNNANDCDDDDVCTVSDTCHDGFCDAGHEVCFDCTQALNLVRNCNLSSGESSWLSGFFGAATGSQRVEDGMLVVDITNGGTDADKVQPRQIGLELMQGTAYSVKLNARASSARHMAISVTQDGGAKMSYSGEHGFEIGPEMQLLSFEFTMHDAPPSERAKLEVRLGGAADNPAPNTVWLDNFSIEPR